MVRVLIYVADTHVNRTDVDTRQMQSCLYKAVVAVVFISIPIDEAVVCHFPPEM